MYSKFRVNPSRRSILLAGLGATVMGSTFVRATGTETQLAPQWASAGLRRMDDVQTQVLSYDDNFPSPVLRVKQGQPLRVVVENRLELDTTVHWHGIRLPNAMDGVPGLTQATIRPGERFSYEFTPSDAGTFWYHPHANSLEQIGHGLAGLLIVEEAEPMMVDRDLSWLLQDWRLSDGGEIASGFGSMMDAVMAGRVGNTITINGAPPTDLAVRSGERIRLRLANAALARIMALHFEGHQPVIIAIDGQPCEPHTSDNGRIAIGPAMRVDVLLDMTAEPGNNYAIIDDFYAGLSHTLANITYARERLRPASSNTPLILPPNPLPEPNLENPLTQEIVLQGGMRGGGKLKGVGGMNGTAMPGMNGGPVWAINGMSMTGDGQSDMQPLFTLKRGETCLISMRNETAWAHTMHIHGFSMLMLKRNGSPVPYRQWQDTVLMAPTDTVECAFVADNPGKWMFHCHITDYQMTGLMTVFHVT